MRKTAIAKAVVLAAAFGAMSSAMAVEVTANANLTTDYKFRGISQTNRGAAFQGGFDADFRNGFYLGNWNSNVNFVTTGAAGNGSNGLETDVYGGYRGEFKGVGYDLGGLYYYYEKNSVAANGVRPNTFELYGKASYMNAYAKVSYAASENYFGLNSSTGTKPDLRGSLYYDLGYTYPVTDKFSLTGHYGHTTYDKSIANGFAAGTNKSYDDYSLTGAYTVGKYTFSLAYVDTNSKAQDLFGKTLTKGTLIATVGTTF